MLELRARTEARIHSFTEAKYSWSVVTSGTSAVVLHDNKSCLCSPKRLGLPLAMVSGKRGELHVLVDHPFSIHSYTDNHSAYSITPLGTLTRHTSV
jgi:hypothetical protein